MAKWIVDYHIPYEGGMQLFADSAEDAVRQIERLHYDDRGGATVRPEPTVEYEVHDFIQAFKEGKVT